MAPTPELHRIAAAYPPEAQHTPRWEREAYLTDVQHLAWLLRFDPDAMAEALSASEALDAKLFSQKAAAAPPIPTALTTATQRGGGLHG